MPQPYAISFGPWIPDGADIAIGIPSQYAPTEMPLSDCLNVYWSDQGYRSLNALANSGSALSSQCLGATTVVDSTDTPQIYVGNASDLFIRSGGSFSNVSKSAGAYATSAHWSFAQFAGCIAAANGVNVLQDVTIGGGNFADVTGAPIGSVLGVINQSLFVGDITSPTAYPWRVMWSGIGDPTSWPTPLTNAAIAVQSGQQDLTQEFGRVMFIAGGPLIGSIFQQTGITRATYVGGDVAFSFAPFERKRGLVARNAAVQAGDTTYFLAADGFYMTDGSQVAPIGAMDETMGLDRWFWTNVNTSALSTITAGWDATLKCVVVAMPTGSNTLPDTLIIFNPRDRRWTRASGSVASEMMWSDLDTNLRHRLGFIDQTHKLAYLTGTAPSGYVETFDGSFLDGRVRDVIEGQLDILCTDNPTMRIGYRQALKDAITYTTDNAQDTFTRRVTWDPPPAGRLIRARATSTAATALNGVTLFMEMGGKA